METNSDSSRHQSFGALPEQSQEVSANSVAQVNGNASKNRGGTTHKKRASSGKSPVEKKKPRGGGGGKSHPPLVNLNDTVASMQQLKAVAPNAPMPANSPCYQAYSSAYAAYPTPGTQYSVAGVPGYTLSSFSLPTGSLNFPPPGHPQYAASLPQYYPGDGHGHPPPPPPPGYSTSPGGFFPQWRTSYAPMPCQTSLPPTFNYANSGNNGNNVYR